MTDTPDSQAPTGYAEAVAELEAILAEIEGTDVDVDLLATKVDRANVLIEFCRTRISAAQDAVDAATETPDA